MTCRHANNLWGVPDCQQEAIAWGCFLKGKKNRALCNFCLNHWIKEKHCVSHELMEGKTYTALSSATGLTVKSSPTLFASRREGWFQT